MKKIFLINIIALFSAAALLAAKSGWCDRFKVVPPHYYTSNSLCQSSPINKTARIEISTDPSKSVCFVNHQAVGRTPLCLSKLNPGKYLIRIDAGLKYLPYIKTITVSPGETAHVHAALVKKAKIWFQEGMKAMQTKNIKKALNDFKQASIGKPFRVSNAYYWLGTLYEKENKLNSAVKAFRQFIYYKGMKYPVAFYELGKVYKKQKRNAKALTGFEMAVTNLPEYSSTLKSVPAATWKNILKLKKTVVSDPDDLSTRIHLAYLYELKGAFKKAAHQFEIVLANHKTSLKAEEKKLTINS